MIASGLKNTEFRPLGAYRGDADTQFLLFFRTDEDTRIPTCPLRVPILQAPIIMTTAEACIRWPHDAELCGLSRLYSAQQRLHCICLTPERILIPDIVMLRPLNVYSVPQFSEGFIQFCLTEDLDKTVTVEQRLTPTKFSAKRTLQPPPPLPDIASLCYNAAAGPRHGRREAAALLDTH